MAEDKTTVTVSDDTWKRLTKRKSRGDSFDDVIQDLLDIAEEHESEE